MICGGRNRAPTPAGRRPSLIPSVPATPRARKVGGPHGPLRHAADALSALEAGDAAGDVARDRVADRLEVGRQFGQRVGHLPAEAGDGIVDPDVEAERAVRLVATASRNSSSNRSAGRHGLRARYACSAARRRPHPRSGLRSRNAIWRGAALVGDIAPVGPDHRIAEPVAQRVAVRNLTSS